MNLIDVEKIAEELMIKYLNLDWSFKFTNCKKKFGWCHYQRKIIGISKPLSLLNNYEDVINVILHEIAHAMVGIGNNHNKVWRNKALEIGCTGNRCYSNAVLLPPPKFILECMNCGKIIKMYRKRKYTDTACYSCCKKFNNGFYSDKYIFKIKKLDN